MMCSLVSHPWALRTEARPGGSVLALTPGPRAPGPLRGSRDVGLAAVVFPGQVAGGGAARHPHHGELLGVARAGARVGTGARVLLQHGVCGPQAPGSGPPAPRGRGRG